MHKIQSKKNIMESGGYRLKIF